MPHHGGFFTVRRRAAAGAVLAAAILVACSVAWSASGFGGLAEEDTPAAGGGPVGETIDLVRQGPGLDAQDGPESAGPASAAADHRGIAVRLDAAAGGQTVALQVGQQLTVTLGPGWSPPRAQTPASDTGAAIQPVRTDSTLGAADPAAGSTVFTAVRVGQAVVFAQASTGVDFTMTVVVQPVPGQRAGPLPVRAGG